VTVNGKQWLATFHWALLQEVSNRTIVAVIWICCYHRQYCHTCKTAVMYVRVFSELTYSTYKITDTQKTEYKLKRNFNYRIYSALMLFIGRQEGHQGS